MRPMVWWQLSICVPSICRRNVSRHRSCFTENECAHLGNEDLYPNIPGFYYAQEPAAHVPDMTMPMGDTVIGYEK